MSAPNPAEMVMVSNAVSKDVSRLSCIYCPSDCNGISPYVYVFVLFAFFLTKWPLVSLICYGWNGANVSCTTFSLLSVLHSLEHELCKTYLLR